MAGGAVQLGQVGQLDVDKFDPDDACVLSRVGGLWRFRVCWGKLGILWNRASRLDYCEAGNDGEADFGRFGFEGKRGKEI